MIRHRPIPPSTPAHHSNGMASIVHQIVHTCRAVQLGYSPTTCVWREWHQRTCPGRGHPRGEGRVEHGCQVAETIKALQTVCCWVTAACPSRTKWSAVAREG